MVMEASGLELDPGTGEIRFAERAAGVSTREMALLRLLVNRAGEIVSRDELRAVACPSVGGHPRTVDVYVSRVRRRLRSVGHPGIATVFQRGYRLREE